MNKRVQKYVRSQIKEGLKILPERNVDLFKRMYSHENLNLSIENIVDNMPEEKLDHALTQVDNTLEKLNMNVL